MPETRLLQSVPPLRAGALAQQRVLHEVRRDEGEAARLARHEATSDVEPLIQDWEVPWEHAEELIRFSVAEVKLDGKPWAAVPIKTPRQPTIYPIRPNELYFNLGCYCQVRRPEGKEPYYYTKIMDRKCFDLGGIKMLYSSSFLTRPSSIRSTTARAIER